MTYSQGIAYFPQQFVVRDLVFVQRACALTFFGLTHCSIIVKIFLKF